jgi:hypothetical protein
VVRGPVLHCVPWPQRQFQVKVLAKRSPRGRARNVRRGQFRRLRRVLLGQAEYHRRGRDIPSVQDSPLVVSHAQARPRGCAPLPRQGQCGLEFRCGRVDRHGRADLRQGSHNGLEAVGGRGRLRLAASGPVQPVLQGSPKLSRANLFMRANLLRGADGPS